MILASGTLVGLPAAADAAPRSGLPAAGGATRAAEPAPRPVAQADRAYLAGGLDRDQPDRADERPDPDVLAGPTPAFQASVLEIEHDLQNSIARLEAARTARRAEGAIAPRPQAEAETKADTEAKALPRTDAADQPEPDAAAEGTAFALEVPYATEAAGQPRPA